MADFIGILVGLGSIVSLPRGFEYGLRCAIYVVVFSLSSPSASSHSESSRSSHGVFPTFEHVRTTGLADWFCFVGRWNGSIILSGSIESMTPSDEFRDKGPSASTFLPPRVELYDRELDFGSCLSREAFTVRSSSASPKGMRFKAWRPYNR
uniref:Uncharacterized protein n=1 Tax=Cannabis sativa TaxID=3483 RepID=A0A803PS51_CANSA